MDANISGASDFSLFSSDVSAVVILDWRPYWRRKPHDAGRPDPAPCGQESNRPRQACYVAQYLENQSHRGRDLLDSLASYDLSWMWSELGIAERRV